MQTKQMTKLAGKVAGAWVKKQQTGRPDIEFVRRIVNPKKVVAIDSDLRSILSITNDILDCSFAVKVAKFINGVRQ